jgi:hypothetical protein
MSKKFTVYCKIIDYIEANDSDFAEVIRGTCNDAVLTSTRNKPGLTFLYPEKKYIDEIIDKAYSDKPSDVQLASDMIQSLILNNVCKTGAQMKDDKEIANCMRVPQVVEIESVSADTANFKGGAVAKFDSKFKSTNEKLAVWRLTGKLPLKTKDAVRRVLVKRGKGKSGAYQPDAEQSQMIRFKIMRAIETIYLAHEQQRVMVGLDCDIYLKYTVSLLKHLKDNDQEAFAKVMPKISLDKSDLYFMIQPHARNGSFIIDDNVLSAWWEKNSDYRTASLSDADKFIHAWMKETKADRKKIAESVDRKSIIASNNIADQIRDKYSELSGAKIGDEVVFNSQKILEDEVRFMAADMFCRFEADNKMRGKVDHAKFEFITNYIGDLLQSENNQLINQEKVLMAIRPIEKIKAMETFACGSWFCYVPMCKDEFNVKFRPKRDNDIVIMNEISQHERQMSTNEVMDLIRGQSDEFKQHLKKELERI